MSIPNTIVKFVDKKGDIVDFDTTRIANAINKAILDVDGTSMGLSMRRANRYADKVTRRVFNEYYDLNWTITSFIIQFVNFDAAEREGRMQDSFVTERVSFILLEKFKDHLGAKKLADEKEALKEFIINAVESAKLDTKYTEGLFPQLSDDIREELISYLSDQVLKMSEVKPTPEILCPTREYIQDTVEKELKDTGEIDIAEGYMIYREGRKKIHAGDISDLQFTSNGIPVNLVRKTLEWNVEHDCDSIFSLNDWVAGRGGKDIRELIKLSEERYKNDILATAKHILERKSEIRVVIVAGPSCSNKTTTTVIVGNELQKENLKFKQLNVDDYFYDLAQQPKDEFGDYDFEMPEAIDIPLLNQHLEQLMAGEEIQKPIYNFKTGMRDGSEPFHLEEDEIVLIDCLHGLYRNLTESVPQNKKFRIYIESMNVVRNVNGRYTRWADIRMLKRMIRDVKHRGYSPDKTLGHWAYVRKGELKHIIPYIFTTEAVINSGMPYELPVLKQALGDLYPTLDFIESLRVEGRLDAYVRGVRTYSLMKTAYPLTDWDLIPPESPIREFIGGSSWIIPHND